MEEQYKQRVEKLEARLAEVSSRRKETARRSKLDIEGLTRDTLELRRQLQSVKRVLGREAELYLKRELKGKHYIKH